MGIAVTAYSPYQGYPGPPPAAPILTMTKQPIFVASAEPAKQNRATVFFRLIMLVPQYFVFYFIFIAAEVVAFIGWWGALFTGRLPGFAVDFLSGALRWGTRILAYQLLLTDAYPPFAMDEVPTYPVRVAIPPAQRLNRAAVFFRAILVIPANFLAAFLMCGATTLMGFVAWLITLFTGKLPPAYHLANTAVLRFYVRYMGYYAMLTPAYPSRAYGDLPGTVSWADAQLTLPAPGYGAPQPGTPQQGFGVQPGFGAPQGYGPPQDYGSTRPYEAAQPGGYYVFQPNTWLLRLTSRARALVTTYIVLGVIFIVGYWVVGLTPSLNSFRIGTDPTTALSADISLNQDYTKLGNDMTTVNQSSNACGNNLACATKAWTTAAADFTTFASQLNAIQVPSDAAADKAQVAADTSTLTRDFTELSGVTSVSQYLSTVNGMNVQQAFSTFNADMTKLDSKLKSLY